MTLKCKLQQITKSLNFFILYVIILLVLIFCVTRYKLRIARCKLAILRRKVPELWDVKSELFVYYDFFFRIARSKVRIFRFRCTKQGKEALERNSITMSHFHNYQHNLLRAPQITECFKTCFFLTPTNAYSIRSGAKITVPMPFQR